MTKKSDREAVVRKVCDGIRAVRSDIAAQEQGLPLSDVDTLLSVALSDAEGVLAKLKHTSAMATTIDEQ